MAFLTGAAQAADLSVLSSLATKEVYPELVAQFEKESGHKVTTAWAGTVEITKRVQSGSAADVVILGSDTLETFIDSGKVVAGSRVDLARSGVGVAVKAGAPKPDISSVDALKRALAAAKTVAISTGPSGVYLNSLFQKLGMQEELKPKLRVAPSGTPVGDLVVKGEAEIGFQQVSELVHFKGIQFVGPLPAEVQRMTVFSGGVHVASQEPDAARALLRFLARPEHAETLRKYGLEPGAASSY
jgi:molybdate transport system substrate-binding protein